MVAPDEGQPAREPRGRRPERAGVGAGAEVPEQEGPVVGRDRGAPVPDEDPIHLADVGGEERPGRVDRDPRMAEVEVGQEPGLARSTGGAARRARTPGRGGTSARDDASRARSPSSGRLSQERAARSYPAAAAPPTSTRRPERLEAPERRRERRLGLCGLERRQEPPVPGGTGEAQGQAGPRGGPGGPAPGRPGRGSVRRGAEPGPRSRRGPTRSQRRSPRGAPTADAEADGPARARREPVEVVREPARIGDPGLDRGADRSKAGAVLEPERARDGQDRLERRRAECEARAPEQPAERPSGRAGVERDRDRREGAAAHPLPPATPESRGLSSTPGFH